MPIFVVLLCGINVGKAKRLAMADFGARLADLGYSQVTTRNRVTTLKLQALARSDN